MNWSGRTANITFRVLSVYTDTTVTSSPCAPNWNYYPDTDTCYKICGESTNYTVAVSICEHLNASVAAPLSDGENVFLANMASGYVGRQANILID